MASEFEKQFGKDAPAIGLVRYFEDNAKFCTAQVLRLQGLGDSTTYGAAIKEYDTVAKVWEGAAQAARTMLKVPNLDPQKCECGKGDYCPLWEHGMPSEYAKAERDARLAAKATRPMTPREQEDVEIARLDEDEPNPVGDAPDDVLFFPKGGQA